MSFYSSKEEIVKILSAKTVGTLNGVPCRGVEFDSRNIKGGELFVALKGEVQHGHEYIGEAYKRGAALFLVEDASLLNSFEEPERLLVVSDTLEALWALASFWRRKLNLPTIAVTGSVGKTTTKEILAAILLQKGPGNYALKSFNNHVGVPYTMLRSSDQHAWCVLEVGMNHPGEIEKLSRLAEPDVSVVTEIAPAHIGAFGNIEGIVKEKLSIVSGLRKEGTVVINGDNEHLRGYLTSHPFMEDWKIVKAGSNSESDLYVSKVTSTEEFGISFHVSGSEIDFDTTMQIPGRHNAVNAVIACAGARALLPSITQEELKRGLEQFRAPLMRLNMKIMPDGRLLLDDSYNANPASMDALLQIAFDIKESGKKIGLILGDMLELGALSEQYHRILGQNAAKISPSFLLCVGEMAPLVVEEASKGGIKALVCADPAHAAKMAVTEPFDVLFVKGSRGIKLDQAVHALLSPVQP